MKGLGNFDKKIYLSIKNGKVVYRPSKDAAEEEYSFVEGYLKGINSHEMIANGRKVECCDFIIENSGETYTLSTALAGGVTRGILFCLPSITDLGGSLLRIVPYKKVSPTGTEFTNIVVYANNQKVGWAEGIDPHASPSDRLEITRAIMSAVNQLLKDTQPKGNMDTVEIEQSDIDDMPGDLPEQPSAPTSAPSGGASPAAGVKFASGYVPGYLNNGK